MNCVRAVDVTSNLREGLKLTHFPGPSLAGGGEGTSPSRVGFADHADGPVGFEDRLLDAGRPVIAAGP